MLETVSIHNMVEEEKIFLLKELGYDSDGEFVLDEHGNQVIDEYADIPVKLDNMVILPGSIKVLDDNPLSIASYMEEHPDAF